MQDSVGDYQSRLPNLSSDLDYWRTAGHKLACSSLAPVLRWFLTQQQTYPKLAARETFRKSYESAHIRLQALGYLETGMTTDAGTVEERLGSGSFGTVWRVRPRRPEAPLLAYKVYHPQDLVIAEKASRFRRGYRAMQQLDHPHIVKVSQFTECPLGFYMDFIAGPNLRQLAGGLQEPTDLLSLLLVVAETVQHTHGRAVVHRDVKPENILLQYDEELGQWRPYLTDFDLAWFSTATQFSREALGSMCYAAPEQLAKPGSASAHAPTVDVFAFGQLCFFGATGRDPVGLEMADNVRALRERLAQWRGQQPAAEFLKLYEESTRHEPAQRLTGFREICDRLSSIYSLLKAHSEESDFASDRFAKELVFSIIGLSPGRKTSERSFLSPSGMTSVELNILSPDSRSSDLNLRFCAQAAPALSGAADFRTARRTLNERIDAILRQRKGCTRRSGTQGPYEVFIRVPGVPMHWDGVRQAREIVTRAIDAIEKS